MLSRSLTVVAVGLALAMYAAMPAMAAETHAGKVVEAADGKLIMTDNDGKNRHTHTVPTTATITCDGKACKLEDLKAGFGVTVTIDKNADGKELVTKVVATSKKAGTKASVSFEDKEKSAPAFEGKVVEAGDGRITVTDNNGGNRQTWEVPATARITFDGKACKLEDLKEGYAIKVTTEKNVDGKTLITRIEAMNKKKA